MTATASTAAPRPGSEDGLRVRIVAMYLPQFHPIPEYDCGRGKGFTEWCDVAQARPLFSGHQQPRLPGRLSFYDLRLPETRAHQAELARAHGIEAFCYWHYWFSGRRLFERPFDEVLRSGEPDFPFCLAWANRQWPDHGQNLIEQTYSPGDDEVHARWLVEAWSDPRWLRVDGRPVFAIYDPSVLPDAKRTVETLRRTAARAGTAEPLLLGMNARDKGLDARSLGFDATIDFRPQLPDLIKGRLRRVRLYRANEAVEAMDRRRARTAHPLVPCVFAGWDDSPRRGRRATVIVGYTPDRFAASLRDALELVTDRPFEERLVFVNAWNGWTDGNLLEPDVFEGTRRLEALRDAVVARD